MVGLRQIGDQIERDAAPGFTLSDILRYFPIASWSILPLPTTVLAAEYLGILIGDPAHFLNRSANFPFRRLAEATAGAIEHP